MSTNKLSHLKEWEKIYTPLERILHLRDDTDWLCFHDVNWCTYWVTDDDTFYTLDDLNQLANDGIPKQEVEWTLLEEKLLHSLWLHKKLPIQWERVEIRSVHQWTTSTWDEAMFVCFFLNKPLVKFDDDTFDVFDEWRYPPKKTELTLADIEERLGLDAWSLIIK